MTLLRPLPPGWEDLPLDEIARLDRERMEPFRARGTAGLAVEEGNRAAAGPVGAIYRCWGGWELLYVGQTRRDPEARLEEHRRGSSWWSLVGGVSVEWVPLALLGQAERRVIKWERPRFNVPIPPGCGFCNDREVIPGPGYALVVCPECSGGTWWPPFCLALPPGPPLGPELLLGREPSGFLVGGYVPPKVVASL